MNGAAELFHTPEVLTDWSAEVTLGEVEDMPEDQTMGETLVSKYATYTEEIEGRGVQRGLAQGLEKGRVEALRAVLKRLIARRFGDVPAAMAARIDAATEAELTRWTDGVIDAASLDAVLAG